MKKEIGLLAIMVLAICLADLAFGVIYMVSGLVGILFGILAVFPLERT